MKTKYQIEVWDGAQWTTLGLGDGNEFMSNRKAWAAIAELRRNGRAVGDDSWAKGEFRVSVKGAPVEMIELSNSFHGTSIMVPADYRDAEHRVRVVGPDASKADKARVRRVRKALCPSYPNCTCGVER